MGHDPKHITSPRENGAPDLVEGRHRHGGNHRALAAGAHRGERSAAPGTADRPAPVTTTPTTRRRGLLAGVTVLLSLLGAAAWLLPNLASADAAPGYRIQSGDTLQRLHLRFHRSVACLARRNHISNPDQIYAGRTLLIPAASWCHGGHPHARHHHRHQGGRSAGASRSGARMPARGGAQTVGAFKAWARAQVGGSQFAALDAIWTRESGWNRFAKNPGSGAYGIPQALPSSKMATAGGDWSWNGYTQMRWGLDYIRGRYGSPSRAWAFWQAHHWY
ncbi:MAG: LysM peptidoglycan-binding domain-containing protein [Nocardioidaceae bacterium]